MNRPEVRYVKPGEMLAMSPRHVLETDGHDGRPKAFFWLFGGGAAPSEQRGSVAIVRVRDALEHHASMWSDSYESIVERVRDAMAGKLGMQAYQQKQYEHERAHAHEPAYQPLPDIEATPPSAVILEIDSPGGVVSGLNECVFALQRMTKESGVPLIAYINELAASAAFAIACGCSKRVCPPSAIAGSIGVISTMVSQASKNAKDGYDVRLITSGARKADGHLHARITDDAVAAEADRVNKLAASFFKIAAKACGLPVTKIEGMQAGIFLGADAERRGLVDDVMGFDEAIAALQPIATESDATAQGNETDRRAAARRIDAASQSSSVTNIGVPHMSLKLSALIKKAEASLASETDPKKRAALAADLSAYKKTEKHIEHTKSEEGEPDDDEEPEKKKDPDDDEEEKKAAAAKAEEEAASKAAEEEEAKSSEEEKKASAAAIVSLIEARTGRKGAAAMGAAMAQFAQLDSMGKDVAALKAQADKTERAALVATAQRYVPPHTLSAIKALPVEALRAFVTEASKGERLVHTSEGELIVPRAVKPGTEQALPAETLALIDDAVAHCGLRDTKAFRKSLVDAHIKAHEEARKASNGGSERY